MRITVERTEGTPKAGRTVRQWVFYVRDGGTSFRVMLDHYVRGTIAPGKRKLDVEVGYDRLEPRRYFFGGQRLDRDLVHIPDDVREEALGVARSLIRFSED